MKVLTHFIFIAGFIFSSCHQTESRLESAMNLAGKNRSELEKVLEYYKDDSQKYKAAVFLIESLPLQNHIVNERYDTIKKYLYSMVRNENLTVKESVEKIEGQINSYNFPPEKNVQDIHLITADYLINNINLAFEVWDKRPWSKHFDFETFCEFVLPYKYPSQPLDNWREKMICTYGSLFDSLYTINQDYLITLEEMNKMFEQGKWTTSHKEPEYWYQASSASKYNYSPEEILENKIGGCYEKAAFTTCLMRALGIPSGVDNMPLRPVSGSNHAWNFVLDTLGNTYEFQLTNFGPIPIGIKIFPRGYVTRNYYSSRENILYRYRVHGISIPHKFLQPNIEEVTSIYIDDNVVKVSLTKPLKDQRIIYLCTFNNKEWIPMRWARTDGTTAAVFNHVDTAIVYLPAYYINDRIVPAGLPFLYDHKLKVKQFKPDLSTTESARLYRKYFYPHLNLERLEQMEGAYIEGSNNPFFNNATILFRVKGVPEGRWHEKIINNHNHFQYVRYRPEEGKTIELAELEFYNSNLQLLKGEVIGTDAWANVNEWDKYKSFDGDIMTSFSTYNLTNSWVGMAFEKPEHISKIRYVPTHDDNDVKPGDHYELFFYHDDKWISLGDKIAENYYVDYDKIPSNSLMLLKNHSGGKEERIFELNSGKQIWW